MKNEKNQELKLLLPKKAPKAMELETPQNNTNTNSQSKNTLKAKTWDESKKMWEIAAPAIIATVAQFSIGAVTVAFVGHLGELELAAVSIVQNVLEGFVYGIMVAILSVLLVLSKIKFDC